MAELSTFFSSTAFPRSERARALLDLVALVTVSVLTAVVLALGTGIDAWRHDSLYYLEDYGPKAMREGRWLIHLLFRPVTATPGGLVWLLGNLLFCGFAYRVAKAYRQDWQTALLFALLAAQIPSIYGQSLWPAGTLPGVLLLFAASLVYARMPVAAFYAVFGVLFFGVSQQYYFFLPILHVPWALSSPEGRLRVTARLLVLWVLGFLAGYLCALAIVYVTSGHLGLPIAESRNPHYVTGLASLLENLASRTGFLAEHLGALGRITLGGLSIVAIAAVGVAGRERNENLVRMAVFGASGLALYAATTPVGMTILFRTATPLFFAVLAFAFLGVPGRLHRVLYPMCVLLVFVPFWTLNFANLQWYRTVTETYQRELVRVSPQPPASYEGLIVATGTARSFQTRIEESSGRRARYIETALSEEEGWPNRWRPSALAAGFRHVRVCRGDSCMRRLGQLDATSCLTESDAYCVHGVTPEGRLVLSFVTP